MLQSLFPKSVDLSASAIASSERQSWLTTEVKIVSGLSLSAFGILSLTLTGLNLDFPQFSTEGERQLVLDTPVNASSPDILESETGSVRPNLNLPAFRVGTPLELITSSLGEPTYHGKGYWNNSRAFLYKDLANRRVDLGYLSDISTETIRQTEVSFVESTESVEIEYFLQQLLMEDYSTELENKIARIIDRQSNKEQFEIGSLEGIIQRNSHNRIYLAVWEIGFHQ